MKQYKNVNKVMAPVTIQKNGACPKSLKSRNRLKSKYVMKHFWNYSILLLSIGLLLSGCKKDKEPNKPEFTDEQIETLYKEIEPLADAMLLSDNPDWSTLVEKYKDRKEITAIDANDDGMMVEFANGRANGWLIPTEPLAVNWDTEKLQNMANKQRSSLKTTPKVLIVNAVYYENRPATMYYVEELSTLFNNNVTVADELTNVDFFKNKLSGYDVVFVIAHGNVWNNKTWIVTSEIAKSQNDKGAASVKVRLGTTTTLEEFYAVNDLFISSSYSEKSFLNSMVYLTCCKGLKYETHLGKAFVDKGAKVVVGWNESDCIGVHSGYYLLEYMLNNRCSLNDGINYLKTFSETFDDGSTYTDFTYDYGTHDDSPNVHNARLVFYPSTAGDYKLPIVTSPESYFFDFNDNVFDANFWTKDVGNNNVNDIRVENGVMKLEQNKTDVKTHLVSKTLSFNNTIEIERDVLLHRSNTYFYNSMVLSFNNQIALSIRYIWTNYEKWYGTYLDYGTFLELTNGDVLLSEGYISERISESECFDNWFKEKLVINRNGNVKYYINNVLISERNIGTLLPNTNSFTVRFIPWGWWTGHYQHFDNFSIKTE